VKALIGGQGALSDQMRIAINAIQPSATSIKVATDNVIKDIKTGVSSVQQAVTDVKTLIGRSGALSVQMSDAINAIKPNAASIKAATDNVISDIKLGVSSVERAVTDVKALIGGQGALSVQIGIPTDSIKDINNDTFPDLTNNIFQPTDSVFAKLNYIYWRLKQRSWTQQPGSVHDALQMILKEITAPNTNPINTGVIDIDTMIGGNSYVPLKTRVITLHETMGGILPANPSVAFESALTKATKAREKTVAIYKKITGLDAVAGSVSIFEMLDAIEQRLGE
jgi:hypothetical protein